MKNEICKMIFFGGRTKKINMLDKIKWNILNWTYHINWDENSLYIKVQREGLQTTTAPSCPGKWNLSLLCKHKSSKAPVKPVKTFCFSSKLACFCCNSLLFSLSTTTFSSKKKISFFPPFSIYIDLFFVLVSFLCLLRTLYGVEVITEVRLLNFLFLGISGFWV